MAATPTISERLQFGKSAEVTEDSKQSPAETPTLRADRHGTVCLWGYGIKVFVRNGHLHLHDGVGRDRHDWRFARVGSGLKRLVVISDSGFITLDALRWIFDQKAAAFVMVDRTGTVIASTGPAYGLDDARLRRAQALALRSGVGLQIARELIDKKLLGQEKVAREGLKNLATAEAIARFRKSLATVKTIAAVGLIESQAAAEYWKAWEGVSITFPRPDLRKVPEHWLSFGSRRSPISGSQRLAVNPINGILNYLYALLEAEARLAASAVGLDSGQGFLHFDTKARASLAADLLEPVRPQVDAWVLQWIGSAGLRREWFIEMPSGNCRLSRPLAAELAKTASMWRAAVAPFPEWVAHTLWSSMKKGKQEAAPATRLTQARKREAKGQPAIPAAKPATPPQSVCRVCGTSILPGRRLCSSCAVPAATEQIMKQLPAARIVGHGVAAQARRADTQRRNAAARWSWDPSSQPAWLTEETYARRIHPLLAGISTSAISSALGVSWVYAKYIRLGQRRPHPRHWQALAQLVGVSAVG